MCSIKFKKEKIIIVSPLEEVEEIAEFPNDLAVLLLFRFWFGPGRINRKTKGKKWVLRTILATSALGDIAHK